jgi:hypothetical protein
MGPAGESGRRAIEVAKLGCDHRRVVVVLQVLIYIQLNYGQGESGDIQIALDPSPSQISFPAPKGEETRGHGA